MNASYVVDTPILLDILENDPEYGASSAALIDRHASDTLYVSPISYFALAPAFNGQRQFQDEFLSRLGVVVTHESPHDVAPLVYRSWARYCRRVKAAGGHGHPFMVCLIGALANLFDGIITRRGELYRAIFPELNIVTE